MKWALGFVVTIFVSFLPPRYRGWWRHHESEEWNQPTVVSGLVQALGFAALYAYGYFWYRDWRIRTQLEMIEGVDVDPTFQAAVEYGAGVFSVFEYALNPLSMILLYFLIEGTVRMIAALSAGHCIGTLPLHLVAMVHGKLSRASAERALGPKAPDLVETGDGAEFDLRISCSRPKETWDRLMTISYKDELYEMAEHQQGPPPRRFVYLLRKMPPGKIVRGLEHYRPGEE